MTLFARAGFLYLLVCMGLLAAILILGSGHFTFVIDDPYIHLAMAENLPGHLGLNLEEATDASSSILYPWLLAPFAHSEGAGIGMALALNALAGLGCLYFFARLAGSACQGWLGAVALVGLAAAVNLFALVFMGMEHTLHVLCALALVCGLKDYAATGGLPRWFWLAFFIAPLVRFEALALNALILGWLLLDRRWLWVLAGSVAVALPQVAHA